MSSSPKNSETIANDKRYRISGRFLKRFGDYTSIHGLKLITQNGTPWFERILWILIVVSGILFSSFFCWKMWLKYECSSVFTSLESVRSPLIGKTFPAITICNVNKVSEKRLRLALANPKYLNVSFETIKRSLRYMTKLDRANNKEKDLEDLSHFYKSENITMTDLFELLKKTAPACRDLVMDCSWQGNPDKCFDYFSFRPTDDGICCTFNGAFYRDQELGFQTRNHEPLKIDGNGYKMGLTVVLDTNVNDYSVTNGNFDGFKILAHASDSFPDVADRGLVLSPGTETFLGLKGVSALIADDVASAMPQKKRRCVVEDEMQLKFFSRYSQSSCIIECTTQKMLEACSCRPYFLQGDNSTPLCGLEKYSCIFQISEVMRRSGVNTCGCLPQCSEDDLYEPEISYATFPGRGFNSSRTFVRLAEKLDLKPDTELHYFKSNVAVLHVYYREKTGFLYITNIHFGLEDFIAAVGGLLSLGMGMSCIGAIELVYYLFFRPGFSACLKQRGKRNSSSEDPLPLSYQCSESDKQFWPSPNISKTSSFSSLSDSQLDEAALGHEITDLTVKSI